jgi:hypothetical protein
MENKVRLGLPRIIRPREKRSRTRLQLGLQEQWSLETGCLWVRLALFMTRLRNPLHEETELLTVLKFPIFRVPEYSEYRMSAFPCGFDDGVVGLSAAQRIKAGHGNRSSCTAFSGVAAE